MDIGTLRGPRGPKKSFALPAVRRGFAGRSPCNRAGRHYCQILNRTCLSIVTPQSVPFAFPQGGDGNIGRCCVQWDQVF